MSSPSAVHPSPATIVNGINNVIANIDEEYNAAYSVAETKDLAAIPPTPPLNEADAGAVQEAWKRAHEARTLFEIARSRAAESVEASAKYQHLLKELEGREAALSERKTLLDERQQSLDQQQRQLLKARERVAQREADAEAGFSKQHLASIQALEHETAALRAARLAARDELAAEYERLDGEYRERRAAQEAELAGRRTALEEDLQSKQDALQSEQRELLRQKRRLDAERELLDEDRAHLETLVEQRAARHVERLTADLSATQEQLAQARADRDDSEVRLRAREEADRRFGGRTPEAVLEELSQLRRTNERLANELAERPTAEVATHVSELESQRDAWEQERAGLKARTGELEIQLRRYKVAAWEIETLRDQTEALESQRQLLTQVVADLRSDIRQYAEQDDGNLPFPACSEMDGLPELQTSPQFLEKVNDLATFADELRHRIAYDPATSKRLYYTEQDIRAFIGGLAMSKLHILEGISGTGKTSLPMAFARATGAGLTLVEVQAGWRDRDDLIGHYNAFQNRFQETKLLRALYEAQCPQYAKSPYVVLLDEMNLSRPEQYFADFLSALEVDEHLRELTLMPVGVPRAPKLLVDGRKLSIPSNVWFIGTANHDETTVEFADKTYDRAWVLELPRQNKSFSARQTPTAPPPLSVDGLDAAFASAQTNFADDALRTSKFLLETLAEPLGQGFRVGWGNRLDRQIERFVPVVRACGGSLGEAVDHVVATKLLRKIRDRHDNRPQNLEQLQAALQRGWGSLDKGSEPVRSIEIIRDELERVRSGEIGSLS